MDAVRTSARSRPSASTPSMSGSRMSISTRSGACSAASSTARLAGRRLERAVPGRLQDVAEQLHARLVVLDDEDLLAGHGYAGLAGSVNTNVLPLPSSLSTQIRPPWSSTSRFESARPSPVPSRCATPASPCWNSSKIRSRSSRRDAGAGIGHRDPHLAVDLRRAHVDAPPAGVNFTAFESRLKITCRIRRSSPSTTSTSGVRGERDLDAVLRRLLAHHDDAALERLAERERRDLELDLPGLDLGQVEDVVDQREQMVSRGEDVVEVLLLLLVQRRRTSARAAPARSR